MVRDMRTKPSISHDRSDESIEAKARWFQGLSMEERFIAAMEWMEFTAALSAAGGIHPGAGDDAHKTFKSVRVLEPRRH